MKEQVMYSYSLVKKGAYSHVGWSRGGVRRLSILLKKAYFLKNVEELMHLLFFKFNRSPNIRTPFLWCMI